MQNYYYVLTLVCIVTEYEIERGMLSCPGACNSTALCFMRYIDNLADNLSDAKARMYLDVVPDRTKGSSSSSSSVELDVEAQTLLEELRRKVTSCLTDERNLEYFELDWNKEKRRSPSDDSQYLSTLVSTLQLLFIVMVTVPYHR